MTEQEINRRIVKGVRVKREKCGCGCGSLFYSYGGGLHASPPKYSNDLNACAEMFKTVGLFSKRKEFYSNLQKIVSRDSGLKDMLVSMEECVNATPIQRCEAYLRGEGLWEEKNDD